LIIIGRVAIRLVAIGLLAIGWTAIRLVAKGWAAIRLVPIGLRAIGWTAVFLTASGLTGIGRTLVVVWLAAIIENARIASSARTLKRKCIDLSVMDSTIS
jgi:hypothetical protein